jgi:uncharacterized membrane protein YvlD (DUF360 family)
MQGATGVLIKLGIRLVVFALVFWLVARKHDKVILKTRWVAPVVGLVFAVLNTALYWGLSRLFEVATLGALGIAMPFIINGVLLYATTRIFERVKSEWFRIDGVFAGLWMVMVLTAAHGVCWLALDYIPKHV